MARVSLTSLKDCFLFQGLNGPELDLLASLFQERELTSGKTVFVEQMPGESLYIIRKGVVRITRLLTEGNEKTLVILKDKDVFGEMAVVDGATRFATARVDSDATLLSLRKDDFEKLCAAQPAVALKFLKNIVCLYAQRVRENSEEYREMLAWSLNGTA